MPLAKAKAIIDSLLGQGVLSVPKPGYLEFTQPVEPEEREKKKDFLDHLRRGANAAEWIPIDKYGFDRNRGLETYKISEIKRLVKENGPTKTFLKDLRECVDLHKKFYAAYRGMEEFQPVKNDVATENIERIDRYVKTQELKKVKPVDWDARGINCPICHGVRTSPPYALIAAPLRSGKTVSERLRTVRSKDIYVEVVGSGSVSRRRAVK